MGKQYLNGVPYGVSKPYKELTLEEYEALPPEKNQNGVMYFIKNAGSAVGAKFFALSDIYDTNEREVGVWTDGRPLYQKVYTNLSIAMVASNWITTTIPLDDIKTIIDGRSIDNYGQFHPVEVGVDSGANKIVIRFPYAGNLITTIMLQYTKTTDTPGSGTLGQGGVSAHHYSTTEQVVGTWIDGKPLYERTIKQSFTGVAKVVVDTNIDYIQTIATTYLAGGAYDSPFYMSGGVRVYCFIQRELDNTMTINNEYSGTIEWTVTVQYTKTTD